MRSVVLPSPPQSQSRGFVLWLPFSGQIASSQSWKIMIEPFAPGKHLSKVETLVCSLIILLSGHLSAASPLLGHGSYDWPLHALLSIVMKMGWDGLATCFLTGIFLELTKIKFLICVRYFSSTRVKNYALAHIRIPLRALPSTFSVVFLFITYNFCHVLGLL